MTRQKGRLRITIIVTVISPEASPGKTPFSLVCQLEFEGSLLTDVLCVPRSATDKVRAIISLGLITRD